MVENVKEMIKKEGILKTLTHAKKVARDYVYDLRKKDEKFSFSDSIEGHEPTIYVVRKTLPEVWDVITMTLLGIGTDIHTHYDPVDEKGNYTSFPSIEATVLAHIEEPFSEKRFHKHFLGGWLGFGDYKAEIEGVKDHWVLEPGIVVDFLKKGKFNEIKDYGSWLYSYSQRFRAYPYLDIEAKPQTINQLQSVLDNLTKDPESRSAQCITWDPRWDHKGQGQMKYKDENGNEKLAIFDDYHAPCLQRLWWRLLPTKEGYSLNLNTDWRSRCHLKAFPQNIFGITEGIMEPMRKDLEEALQTPIKIGRYADKSDTLHLYGHYLDPAQQGLDAEAYLQDIFRIAEGQSIEERLILPGTSMYDIMQEDINAEYQKRKANPDFDRTN